MIAMCEETVSITCPLSHFHGKDISTEERYLVVGAVVGFVEKTCGFTVGHLLISHVCQIAMGIGTLGCVLRRAMQCLAGICQTAVNVAVSPIEGLTIVEGSFFPGLMMCA